MGLRKELGPVVLAGAVGLSQLVGTDRPVLADSPQYVDYSGFPAQVTSTEKTTAEKVLENVRPALYKLKMIPRQKGLPIQYGTGWSLDSNTLVTAGHVGRCAIINGREVITVDEKGNPLYDMVAYQDQRHSTGNWNFQWIAPKKGTDSRIDIGIWKTNRPLPQSLKTGDPSSLRAGEHLFLVHYPGGQSTPGITEGIVIAAPDNFMTLTTWNPGSIAGGSSGGLFVRPDGEAMGVFNTDVRRKDKPFQSQLELFGIRDSTGISAFLYGTTIDGLSRFGD